MVENGVSIGRCYSVLSKVVKVMTVGVLIGALGLSAAAQENSPSRLNVNKKMIVNFGKSLLIPGWGQWSNGNKVRAAAYVLAELGGIYGYQSNHEAGYEKEQEFKAFANDHWNYDVWILTYDGETSCGQYLSTHPMPTYTDEQGVIQPIKDHHFYENISKYKEFVCGWDDVDQKWEEGSKVYTPRKLDYIEMRTRSNDLYRNAQVAGTLIMLNHLISAFDAAFGTDITTFESTNYNGKFYINALHSIPSVKLEVKF